MTAYDPDAALSDDLALRLALESSVTLYRHRSALEEATAWLADHGYRVVTLAAGRWSTDEDLHRDVAEALDFPDHYGRNLDALEDCLREVAAHAYSTAKDAAGLVVVLTDYDRFARARPRTAQLVLDIVADSARRAALFGHRVLALVHGEDPDLAFEPVGATPVVTKDGG